MSLGNGTYHESYISFWDKSREKSALSLYGLPVTATIVSTDVVNFTDQASKWAAVITASEDLSRGLIYAAQWVNLSVVNAYPDSADIDQQAVREIKLQVQMIDATTQERLNASLPCLNLSLVTYLPQAKDFVAITDAQGAGDEVIAFVAAVEAYAVNPRTGHPVQVVGLKVIGVSN